MSERYTQLCWDCKDPLDKDAVKVPVHGRLQPVLGGSDVFVCPGCAKKREDA